ncbi:hypothetical protein AAG906_035744 [Vitis piasezkii]
MVSERGIEVDPDKIRAILDMPAPKTEREVRGFIGRLQYISRFIARLTDIWSIVADHLASLPIFYGRAIDDDFPNEDVAIVTSLSVCLAFSDRHLATNNIVEYEACILGQEMTLELGIRQMEVFGDSNMVLRQIQGEWKTRDAKLRPYHAYLELLFGRFDDLRYTYLPRA